MSELARFIKDFGPPVAWIIAAIGLFYNNSAANQRERRKEFRGEIDQIASVVKEAIRCLQKYHALHERSGDAKMLELEIKAFFRELDLISERVQKRDFSRELAYNLTACQDAYEKFYDKATGMYFESDSWFPFDEKAVHFHEANVLGLVLIESLYSLFAAEYDRSNSLMQRLDGRSL